MKFVPNTVSRKVGRQILLVQKNSPTLLFAVGIAGFVGTIILSNKATLKLDAVLNEHEEALETAKEANKLVDPQGRKLYSDRDLPKDLGYVYARTTTRVLALYGPAALVCGTLSVAALTGSHHILSKRNVALTAAYAALEKGFNEYRDRVRDQLGEEKEHDLRFPKCEEDSGDGKKKKKVVSPHGASVYARFFDEFSQSWSRTPEYNMLFLKAQQNYANDLLQARGHVFLNEVYDMLGLERSQAGAVVGWIISKSDGDNFIDFGIFNRDSESSRRFVNGIEGAILLDFNVDGLIYDKI